LYISLNDTGGEQSNEDENAGTCSTHLAYEKCYRILEGKLERKKITEKT
jgi:hypothetical protein